MSTTKSHQTLTVYLVAPDASSKVQERVKRHAGSLNGSNIKSDILTVDAVTGAVSEGVVFPTATPASEAPTVDEIIAQGKAQGYVLVNVVDAR